MNSSNRFIIVPIVEGHGEVEAVPTLLNRWFMFRRFTNFGTPREATRGHRGSLAAQYDPDRENGIEVYVRRAAARRPDGILVILDSDDDCGSSTGLLPHEQLGPKLLQRASQAVNHIPIAVVVANREFEAWFLAGYRRLVSRGQFKQSHLSNACFHPESPRNCKEKVQECLGRTYSPTVDQRELVSHLGFGSYMSRYSRSFRKLMKELETITRRARENRRQRIQKESNKHA